MMRNILLIYFIIFIISKKLLMIHQIFRHGARYPLQGFATDYSQFTQKMKQTGQLTKQGKHMHYILGKIIYDKYWENLFNGTEYTKVYHPSQIFVKSTNMNRTIQSAQSHLLGLLQKLQPLKLPKKQLQFSLPPFVGSLKYQDDIQNNTQFNVYGSQLSNYQSIPIHTQKQLTVYPGQKYKYRANPYDQGQFLIKFQFNNCPNQKFWSKQNMADDQAMAIKKNIKVKQYLANLSNTLKNQTKYQQAYKYYDDYVAQKYLGKKYLSIFDNQQIRKTAQFVSLTSLILTYFYNQEQIKIGNTRLLQSILHNMKNSIINTGPKMVFYSGHDTTLMSLASALQMTSINCIMQNFNNNKQNSETCINKYPVFASNFIVQLWQQDNLTHSVKILYNGIQKIIPICNNKKYCTFNQFQKWVNQFAVQDPNDLCGIREQYTKLYIVIGILSIFLAIFIALQIKSRFKQDIQKKLMQMQQKKGYLQNFQQKQVGSQKHSQLQ